MRRKLFGDIRVAPKRIPEINLSTNILDLTEESVLQQGFIPIEPKGRAVRIWVDPTCSQPKLVQTGTSFKQLIPVYKDGDALMYH